MTRGISDSSDSCDERGVLVRREEDDRDDCGDGDGGSGGDAADDNQAEGSDDNAFDECGEAGDILCDASSVEA